MRTKWVILIICLIFFAWLGSGIFLWKCIPATEPKGPGVFGDMFGAINSLFSGLALAGIIYTILLQREELSLQREELRLTREEMKRSADAQENADKSFKDQVDLMIISNTISSRASLIDIYSKMLTDPLSGNVSNDLRLKAEKNLGSEILSLEKEIESLSNRKIKLGV